MKVKASRSGNGDSEQLRLFRPAPLGESQKELVTIYPPQDVVDTLKGFNSSAQVVMLDP